MRLLMYGEAECKAGLDPTTLEGRARLPVVKRRVSQRAVLAWANGGECPAGPGWRFRRDDNVFGFCGVNAAGDCLIPDAD